MTRRSLLLAATLSLAACSEPPPPAKAPAAPSSTPAAPSAPSCLSIVAWNDMHGQIFADDPVIDTGRIPAGGVVAAADQVAAVRATGDAVVVLDAGDLFTGPLASTLAEGAPVIEAYNVIGVDAAALGNHDFDFGPSGEKRIIAPPGTGDEAGANGPRGALLERMAEARFPFLSANVHKRGGAPPGWPKHRASVRIARGGFDVGVVGYSTRDTPTTTLKPNVADLDFTTAAAASVGGAIRALRSAGASPVVLLAHASIEGELPKDLSDAEPHKGEIASLISELGADVPDVIVAGHRHAWMLGRVHGVPIVSSDQHGVGLARIRFCREPSGKPKLEGVERRVALASSPPRSELGAKVLAAMEPWLAKVKPIAEEPVANITRECEPKGRTGTRLDDQMARAIAGRVADAAAPPAGVPVVGLVNVGALRAPLVPGLVRFSDIFTVLPFENTVAACGTTRRGLMRLLENALHKESSRERFPVGLAGAKLTVKRGEGGKLSLVSLEIDGEPKGAGDDAPVWLALSDFILYGGDDLLAGVTCSPASTSQTRVRDAWREVLAREKTCDGPSQQVHVE